MEDKSTKLLVAAISLRSPSLPPFLSLSLIFFSICAAFKLETGKRRNIKVNEQKSAPVRARGCTHIVWVSSQKKKEKKTQPPKKPKKATRVSLDALLSACVVRTRFIFHSTNSLKRSQHLLVVQNVPFIVDNQKRTSGHRIRPRR